MTKKLIHAAGCFIEFKEKFLILKRRPDAPQGNTWGLTGGEIVGDESPEDCLIKKIKQETGLRVNRKDLHSLGSFKLEYPDVDVQFFAFSTKLKQAIKVTLDPKGSYDYKWISAKECYALPDAMAGLYVLLEKIGAVKSRKRPQPHVQTRY